MALAQSLEKIEQVKPLAAHVRQAPPPVGLDELVRKLDVERQADPAIPDGRTWPARKNAPQYGVK